MKINDVELFVEDLGNKDGEVIVFLNGVMASTNSWYQIMKPFIELGYRIILHDFKGQLKSDKPKGPYTFEEHARETVEILNKSEINKAHFIGTSYGGEVALNIGFRYPNLVKSLVIIDSVSETDLKMKNEINYWIKLCENKDGYAFFWGMAKSIYGSTFMMENKDFLEQRAQATKHVDPSYLEGQIILYKTFNDDVYMNAGTLWTLPNVTMDFTVYHEETEMGYQLPAGFGLGNISITLNDGVNNVNNIALVNGVVSFDLANMND